MICAMGLGKVPQRREHLVEEGFEWVVELGNHKPLFPDNSDGLGNLLKDRERGILTCVLVGE